jgi:hypothetical protein
MPVSIAGLSTRDIPDTKDKPYPPDCNTQPSDIALMFYACIQEVLELNI